jgi:precorrin-2/cobalt-factor-2 C20-methyltransferase
LVLLPLAHGAAGLAEALEYAEEGTVVVYKGGRHLTDVAAALKSAGRLDGALLGAHLGLPGERVEPLSDVDDAPYLSSVLIPARRTHRGGKI